MQKNTVISIVVSIALIGGTLYIVSDKPAPSDNVNGGQAKNIEIKEGVQYVTITAQGGYFPRTSQAKAGIPTKLIVKTDGTYDCSASLIIRSLKFQKVMKPVSEEVIDLGILKSGEKIQGVCGMGMYNFQIKAE